MTDLRKEEWRLGDISQSAALDIIRRCHYAKSGPNTASFRHGLFPAGSDLPCGVALWLPPPPQAAKSAARDAGVDDWHSVLSLSRLAIEAQVPTGAASFLIGRSIRLIRRHGRYRVLLTFADEYQEHSGAIYRATNWTYMGKTKPYYGWIAPDGRLVSKKMGPKTRSSDEMTLAGYRRIGPFRKHRFLKVIR